MMAAEFYERVIAAAQPPAERHARLAQLHSEVLAEYLDAVQALPEAEAERLERTRPFRKRLQNGLVVRDVAMGWNLWITVLEHAAVEHAADLSMKH